MTDSILEVKNLKLSFSTPRGRLFALRDVSFSLKKGETLAIVGESGSGKSVTSKAILGILAGNASVDGGKILYKGQNLLEFSEEEMCRIRGSCISMVHQDPMSSLDPTMKIGKQVSEAMLLKAKKRRAAAKEKYARLSKRLRSLLSKLSDNDGLGRELLFYLSGKKADEGKVMAALEKLVLYDTAMVKDEREAIITEAKELIEKLSSGLESCSECSRVINRLGERLLNSDGLIEMCDSELLGEKLKRIGRVLINCGEHRGEGREGKIASSLDEACKQLAASHLSGTREKAGFLMKRISALRQEMSAYSLSEIKEKTVKLLKEVGISNAEERYNSYPHEFSGGMRQRIVIAIALATDPDVLICDEPTTALDVTIQAQILELLKRLKKERELSVIFITHDLGVVANIADRVAVMYAGRIVEEGEVDEVFYDPRHPYTWALLSSMPDLDTEGKLDAIPGTPPSLTELPEGDAFAPRNKYALVIDYIEEPPMFEVSPTHRAATWLLSPEAPRVELPVSVKAKIEASEGKERGREQK